MINLPTVVETKVLEAFVTANHRFDLNHLKQRGFSLRLIKQMMKKCFVETEWDRKKGDTFYITFEGREAFFDKAGLQRKEAFK